MRLSRSFPTFAKACGITRKLFRWPPIILLAGLLLMLLMYFIVQGAVSNGTGDQPPNAKVRPILLSSSIQVGLSKRNDDGEVFLHQGIEFLSGYKPTRENSRSDRFEAASRGVWWDNHSSGSHKYLWGFFIEPLVREHESVLTNKDSGLPANFHCWRLPIVAALQVNNDILVGHKYFRDSFGYYVGSLIPLELSAVFLKSLPSNFGLLRDLGDEPIRLLPTAMHFVQLSAHGVPLKSTDKRASDCGNRDCRGEPKLQEFFSPKTLLKGIYLTALFVLSSGILVFAWTRQIERRRPYLLAFALIAFITLCFHFAWVLLYG